MRRRARGQPVRHAWPARLQRAAAGDQRDVAAGQLHVLLVAAADGIDERTDTRRWRDVVLRGPHRQQRARDRVQPHGATAVAQLTTMELVALIEIATPLQE